MIWQCCVFRRYGVTLRCIPSGCICKWRFSSRFLLSKCSVTWFAEKKQKKSVALPIFCNWCVSVCLSSSCILCSTHEMLIFFSLLSLRILRRVHPAASWHGCGCRAACDATMCHYRIPRHGPVGQRWPCSWGEPRHVRSVTWAFLCSM